MFFAFTYFYQIQIYWQRLKFSRILDCSSIKVTRIVVKNLLYKSGKKMWRSRWKKLWKTDAFHNFYHHFNNFRKWAGQIFKKSKKALLKTVFQKKYFIQSEPTMHSDVHLGVLIDEYWFDQLWHLTH